MNVMKNVAYEIPTSNRFSVLEDDQEVAKDPDLETDLNLTISNLVGNKCKDRPLVPASYENVNFNLFLDSGSPVNLMDEKTYDKYFFRIPVQSCFTNISDIHSNKILVRGCVSFTFNIGRYQFHDSFYVVKNLKTHPIVLMGYPSCGLHNIRLLPDCQGILINNDFFVKHTNCSLVEDVGNMSDVGNTKDVKGMNDAKNMKIENEKMNENELERESLGAVLKGNIIKPVTTSKAVSIESGEVCFYISSSVKNEKSNECYGSA